MIKPTIAHQKGGALDKMWMSVEVELKEKKLIDLQLYGLLQATQKNQRKDIKSDVPEEMPLGKGPHVSFSANSPHKLILTKEMMSNLAPTIVLGLKLLISNLEVQHEDIVKEINHHLCDQIKLASLLGSLVTWLHLVLTVNIPLKDADDYEDDLHIVFQGTLINFHTMTNCAKNHTIERHGSKRKFLLEQISLPFKYIEYVFDPGGEKYDDDEGIAISGLSSYTGRYQEDIARRLQDTLQQYLDASLETTKKLKFYTMQIIVHKSGFKAVEV
nr:7992_t:CDS:2 [Entrophospora candida]